MEKVTDANFDKGFADGKVYQNQYPYKLLARFYQFICQK
jgi:hypothetical protein